MKVPGKVQLGLYRVLQDVLISRAAWFARNTDFDPRLETPAYVMIKVIPEKIQSWRTAAELSGRDVMKNGAWLA